MTVKPLIAAGLLALVGVQAASADPAYPPGALLRLALSSYVFVAPKVMNGGGFLTVLLQLSKAAARSSCRRATEAFTANRPDLAVPPVPIVAEVMNGGGDRLRTPV